MAPNTTGTTPSPTLANSTLPACPPPDLNTTTPFPAPPEPPPGLYYPLDKERKEIRLLEIVSIKPRLQFTLHVESLQDNPVFSALSYRWGGAYVPIIVNGKEMKVAKNLVDAVNDIHRHLTEPVGDGQPRLLWADAVCIKQSELDKSDKSQQVPLMKDIYTQAKQVLAWLGPAAKSTYAAFNTLRLLHEGVSVASGNKLEWMKNHDNLCRAPLSMLTSGPNPWSEIMDLIKCDYWHRVWIFQELFLGNEVLLISGTESLAFNHLIHVYEDLSQALNTEDRPEFFSITTWLDLIRFSRMLRLLLKPILDFRDRVRNLKDNERPWVELMIVFPLFRHALLEFGASDPRDYLYAFFGLSESTIKPDYDKKAHLVYIDYFTGWQLFCAKAMEYEQYKTNNQIPLWFLNLAWLDDTAPVEGPTVSWLPRPRHSSGGSTFPGEKLINPEVYSVFTEADGCWHIRDLGLHCIAVRVDGVCNLGVHVEGSPRQIPEMLRSHLVHDRWRIRGTIERVWPESSGKVSLVSLLEFLFENGEDPTSPRIYDNCDFLYQILFDDATETTLQNKGHVRDAMCCMVMLVWPELEDIGESPILDEFPVIGDDGFAGFSTVDREPLKISELVSDHFRDEWLLSTSSDVHGLEGFLEEMSERWKRIDEERRKKLPSMVIDSLRSKFMTCHVTRTEKGYTAMLPLHAREGDGIWLLKNYDRPVALRPKGDSYVFVGNCGLFNVFERQSEPLEATVRDFKKRVHEIRIE